MESRKLKLNETDMKKVGKGLLIAIGGAVLTYTSQVVMQIDWGLYTPMVVAGSSVLINLGWKFVKGSE